MRPWFVFYSMILCSCRDLPVRIDSAVKPSREPVLEVAAEQNFTDYVQEQSEELLDSRREVRAVPQDFYTLYRRGGRVFLRQFFRKLRDQELDAPKVSGLGEVSLEFGQIFPWIGWELTATQAPILQPELMSLPELDPLRRLMFFEAGVRVKGAYQKTAEGLSFELIYKVVHEQGEPLYWLERDEWGTRLRFDLRYSDPHHQLLWITREVGVDLYERPWAESHELNSLLLSWDQDGALATFQIQVIAGDVIKSLSVITDHDRKSIEIRHDGL